MSSQFIEVIDKKLTLVIKSKYRSEITELKKLPEGYSSKDWDLLPEVKEWREERGTMPKYYYKVAQNKLYYPKN